jgi:hypothetical protein
MAKYTYTEYQAYSPLHDDVVCRVSIGDGRNGEHFALIPLRPRSHRRDRRQALDELVDAIEAGDPPGEVTVLLDDGLRRDAR